MARLAELAGEPLAWVGLIVATFGVIARAWVISGPMGTPDLDAATVGIQAQQFLDGHLQVFFLNQPYGGTLEVAMVAAAFVVGGVNVAMMKLVPLALHAVAVVLTWRIARRVTDDRLARFLAPCLLWIFPAGMVWNSTKQRGFYGIAIVLAALTLLFALRVVQEGTATADLVVLGLVAGLGWWTTPLLAPIALASGGWALIESPDARRRVAWLVIPAALGAAPWLGWNAVNGWESLSGGRAEGWDWLEGASGWLRSLGMLTGTATPWDLSRNLVPWWLAALILGLVVVIAWLRTREAVGWLLPGIVVIVGVTAPLNLVLALSPGAPRYLYPLMPVVAVILAVLVPDRSPSRAAWAAAGVLTMAAALTAWGLVGMDELANEPTPNFFIASPGIDRVVHYLERRGIDVVTTDSAGMQITFLSGGEIVASSFGSPRVEDFERLAAAVPETTFVLAGGPPDNPKRLRTWADSSGATVTDEAHIGQYWVISFDQRVTANQADLQVFGGVAPPRPGSRPEGGQRANSWGD